MSKSRYNIDQVAIQRPYFGNGLKRRLKFHGHFCEKLKDWCQLDEGPNMKTQIAHAHQPAQVLLCFILRLYLTPFFVCITYKTTRMYHSNPLLLECIIILECIIPDIIFFAVKRLPGYLTVGANVFSLAEKEVRVVSSIESNRITP